MKHFSIARNLLKTFAMAGLLMACNNEQLLPPLEKSGVEANDQNARKNPLIRLVNDDSKNILYIKGGRYAGKIAKVLNYYPSGLCLQYTYADDAQGNLIITEKLCVPNGPVKKEWKHKVVNDLCMETEDLTDGTFTQYEYDQLGYKQEAKLFEKKGGKLMHTWSYTYNYNAGAKTFRLGKMTFISPTYRKLCEVSFTYTKIPNKFSLYLDFQGDIEYLPIHGKQSDVLVDQIVSHEVVTKIDSKQQFAYTTDKDGFVTSRTVYSKYLHGEPYSIITQTLKFSDNWQGI